MFLFYQNISFFDSEILQTNWSVQARQTNQLIILFFSLPKTITSGLEMRPENIVEEIDDSVDRMSIVRVRRGGRLSVYGPGQLIIYPLFPIGNNKITPQAWLAFLEYVTRVWLRSMGFHSLIRKNLTGVWIKQNNLFYKIASIGIGVKQGVSQYGISINLVTKDSLFSGFISCGNHHDKMISLKDLWPTASSSYSEFPSLYRFMCSWQRIFVSIARKMFPQINGLEG